MSDAHFVTPADLKDLKQTHLNEAPQAISTVSRPGARDRALYKYAHLGWIRKADLRRAGEGDPDLFDEIASLAEDEDWDGLDANFEGEQRILRNYIEWTFERAKQQHKVLVSSDARFSAFNTGLATAEQETIFGLFEPNRHEDRQPWYFRGWRVDSDREILENFPEPPDYVTYTDNPADYYYDWHRELKPNGRHIIKDNLARFPESIRADHYGLELRVDAAIERAKKRVRRNYKTAVPMWYPAEDQVQLLLPLSLTRPDFVDLALVVSRIGEHYRGNTLLTMGMAYGNARLLARPDSDWLRPAGVDAADSTEALEKR